jgi:amidase
MADVAFATATELCAALRSRSVSSAELLELFVDRIERHNGRVNAIVTLDLDRAFARSKAADDATSRGESWGPLHGLPMTVKDAFETAGLLTTSGAPELREHVPTADAVSVGRLRAAGAVVFGKTNLPMYAGDVHTHNELFGTTNNPWNLGCGVGGSSGGSAAALAAGLTGFELGSDLGGSLRNPAHFCGVFALKPTHGVVPCRGHIPGPPGTLAEMDVASPGPMGRSVADLDLGLDVLSGPLPDRRLAWEMRLPASTVEMPDAMRVAAWLDDPDAPVGHDVATVLASAVEELRRAGMTVDVDARPGPRLSDMLDLWRCFTLPLHAAFAPDDGVFEIACAQDATPPAQDEPDAVGSLRAMAIRHRDWLRADERRHGYLAQFADFFDEYDVLLTPVAGVTAPPHDHGSSIVTRTIDVDGTRRPASDILTWPSAFGALWLPAVTVPVGVSAGGLPVGMQIVGPYLGDKTVLAVAAAIEEALGGFTAPPAFDA